MFISDLLTSNALFQKPQMSDIISVPLRHYMKRPKNCSYPDCPTPIVCLRYLGTNYGNKYTPVSTITITNNNELVIKPFHFKKVTFSVMVVSSKQATSFIYGSDYLFKLGLSFLITFIPTNDTNVYITVYNHTSETLYFSPHSLQFYCTTSLTY